MIFLTGYLLSQRLLILITVTVELLKRYCLPFYAALLRRRGPHIASHSVCLSVCPSVPFAEVVLLFLFTFFHSRTVLRANIQNRKTSLFAYGPANSRMYFSARTEGRISYGHLGRTNLCYKCF